MINTKTTQTMKEVFKSVKGYKGYYQVSNLGNVKSLSRKMRHTSGSLSVVKERILRATANNDYRSVTLYKNGNEKSYKVSLLVAVAFLGHKPNGTHRILVDHISGDKTDDKLNNLQLITQRENCSKDRRNGSSKYTGVCWAKRNKKWLASIQINGKSKYLGLFTNEAKAAAAYQKALKEI